MPITGIHHHSVVVSDLKRSRQFYRDALGLEEVPVPSTFHFVVAWFAVGNEQIHLLPRPAKDPISPRHVALHVRDLDSLRAHLEAAGIATRDTDPIPGARRFFADDPDGNLIELIEWSSRWPTADPDARIRP